MTYYILEAELEALIKKVVRVAKTDPKADEYVGLRSPYKEKSEILEDAAGNHAFDDHPEVFGITENEGHDIRAFFQRYSCRRDEELKQHIDRIIEEA